MNGTQRGRSMRLKGADVPKCPILSHRRKSSQLSMRGASSPRIAIRGHCGGETNPIKATENGSGMLETGFCMSSGGVRVTKQTQWGGVCVVPWHSCIGRMGFLYCPACQNPGQMPLERKCF
jgi:hypothetical protein